MLEKLSGRFRNVLRFLKGEVKLTEENMQQALREIRLSLLEADVNFRVVKSFCDSIRQKLLGSEVQQSLNPYQQIVKIVHQELVTILGNDIRELKVAPRKPSPVMLTGLQGTGKTTTAAKLGLYLKNQGKAVLLGSLDAKRPAAFQQLATLAAEVGLPVFTSTQSDPIRLAAELRRFAEERGYDFVIADTAGRLHVDDELMAELRQVKNVLQPAEVVFVADALTGQDAVNSAQRFAETVGIDSVILTKLDADSRGGAALSIVSVTGKPITFVGTGERHADLQKFYPERLAGQILGMGDVLTLIEKAEKEFDAEESEKQARKMLDEEFSLEDFAWQLKQMRKLGSLDELATMLPNLGLAGGAVPAGLDEKKLTHLLAIIQSLTPVERQNPRLIDGRRRLRIARGSGRPVSEVNELIKNYLEMKKVMKKPFFRKLLKKFDFSRKMM